MVRACLVLLALACAGEPTTPAPEPTTTGAAVGPEPPATPTGELTWHTVDHFDAGERYVILGGTDAPATEGRAMESEDVAMFLHESEGEVPELTLVGYGATCVPVRARRVVIVRRFDPDDTEYQQAWDAVAVESECEPHLAVEGMHLDARLVPLEISDPPFGEPILATGEGWTLRLEYGPSEDGICPGFPLHVEVKRNGEVLLAREFQFMLSSVRIVVLGERAWLVLRTLEVEHLIELGTSGDDERFTWPGGYDLAEIC